MKNIDWINHFFLSSKWDAKACVRKTVFLLSLIMNIWGDEQTMAPYSPGTRTLPDENFSEIRCKLTRWRRFATTPLAMFFLVFIVMSNVNHSEETQNVNLLSEEKLNCSGMNFEKVNCRKILVLYRNLQLQLFRNIFIWIFRWYVSMQWWTEVYTIKMEMWLLSGLSWWEWWASGMSCFSLSTICWSFCLYIKVSQILYEIHKYQELYP